MGEIRSESPGLSQALKPVLLPELSETQGSLGFNTKLTRQEMMRSY